MSAIEITDIPAKAAEILEAVERGEKIDIFCDGKNVAELGPPNPSLAQ